MYICTHKTENELLHMRIHDLEDKLHALADKLDELQGQALKVKHPKVCTCICVHINMHIYVRMYIFIRLCIYIYTQQTR